MLFNLEFAKNTILSCLYFFFMIINLYFLIPAAIVQIFTPTAEFVIPIEIPSQKAKAATEIHPVIVEAKCSI